MKIADLVLSGVLGSAVAVGAQRAASGTPKFDVASIKRVTIVPPTAQTTTPATYYRPRVRALQLIGEAFGMQRFRIVGAPGWASTIEFEVVARIPANTPTADVPLMLRQLLSERFGLRAHSEQRNLRHFELTVVSAGRLGPKMTKTAVDCEAIDEERARTGKTAPRLPSRLGEQPTCTTFMYQRRSPAGETLLRYQTSGVTMAEFADWLVAPVGAPVVDRTQLAGDFDVDVEYVSVRSASLDATTDDAPSVFAAVQDQLGLRLQPQSGALDVIVVDALHEPTEN
jgi:uncharacterized protein (TIGR03435 family)